MARRQEAQQPSDVEQVLVDMLLALVLAYGDSARPQVREKGLEERDVAFEADMLAPPEMELTVYATQKRGRVLSLMREMHARGWARMEVIPPRGAYHLFLLPKGMEHAAQITRPWWRRALDRWKARGKRG
ncbi:MAG: hypothetical protein EXR47_05975 [Dehalococcoidia bacterium]|nr:hypothetical protein [Dehalococcoidia bacterium]